MTAMVMLIGLAATVPEKTSQWVVGAGHQGRPQDIQNCIGHALLSNPNEPKGDRGLFGPDSITWNIHANFTVRVVGGVASLMAQALHPRALTAVWDHSDFRSVALEPNSIE